MQNNYGWRYFGLISMICGMLLTNYSLARELYGFESPVTQQRFYNLINTIRCVVCQNQNLADSNAPLAKDLRQKVYGLMQNKATDQQIEAYLIARYGDFILLKPRFNRSTALLWLLPLLCGGLGLIVCGALIYRRL